MFFHWEVIDFCMMFHHPQKNAIYSYKAIELLYNLTLYTYENNV